MRTWKQIWNKNKRIDNAILNCLIQADGFDSGAGDFSAQQWLEYTDEIFKKISIQNSDSVFDVGCGSGAFLFPLQLRGHAIGGIDYSTPLVDLANMIFKTDEFISDEAINIDTTQSYDITTSHGVFLYFENLDYARKVLIKMIKKSTKGIAVLDVPDKAKEVKYHKVRSKGMTPQEYQEKYKDLDHLFYDKQWFQDIADEFNIECDIFDQSFKGYGNSELRFNVVMRK